MHKCHAPIVWVIIAAVLLAGGYFAYEKYSSDYVYDGVRYVNGEPVGAVVSSAELSGKVSDIRNDLETRDWKTYRNEKYAFEFSMPRDWSIVQENTVVTASEFYTTIQSPDYKIIRHSGGELEYDELIRGGKITVYVQKPARQQTLKELSDFNKLGRGGPVFENERTVTLGGIDALLYDYEGGPLGGAGYHLDLPMTDRWVRIGIQYRSLDGSALLKRLLATFKFTPLQVPAE